MNKSGEFYIGLLLTMLLIALAVSTVDAMSEMTTQNVSRIIQGIEHGNN